MSVLMLRSASAAVQIAWFLSQPRFGLNVGSVPLLDFAVETTLAVACWWYFKR
jgi:hypothetical protein